MAGQHLSELARWVEGMNEEDVLTSQQSWRKVSNVLDAVRGALTDSAPDLAEGFGDSDISRTAPAAFRRTAERLQEQQAPLLEAAEALSDVRQNMAKAKTTHGQPVTVPGPEPQQENFPGIPLIADVQFAVAKAQHNADVAAYNKSDEEAGKRLAELDKSYAAAIAVFTKIHGDPYIEERTDDGANPGGPTGSRPAPVGAKPVRPIGSIIGGEDTGGRDDDGGGRDGDDGGRDDGPEKGYPDPVWEGPGLTPGEPGTPGTPGGPGGSGSGGGINPGLVGGGLLAGGLAAPGALKGISGLLNRAGASSGVGSIGSSSRAGGPGSLGRSGTGGGTPGSPTSRGGSGRAGSGTPGSQGGRGGRGGAGGRGGRGGAGSPTGRGRGKKDDERGSDRDLYDDGQDWLDDKGAGPGVLA